MVIDNAFRINAASARTRVSALVIAARFIHWTFGVLHAFRPATSIRVAKVPSNACARSSAIQFFTIGIGTTGRRVARMGRLLTGLG